MTATFKITPAGAPCVVEHWAAAKTVDHNNTKGGDIENSYTPSDPSKYEIS